MNTLDSSQRSWLFKKAHSISPVILIGQNGLTDNVIKAVDEALESHELIKIKFNEFKDEKNDLAVRLAEAVNCSLVRLVGNIAVLYRHQPDPEKRKYNLPKRK